MNRLLLLVAVVTVVAAQRRRPQGGGGGGGRFRLPQNVEADEVINRAPADNAPANNAPANNAPAANDGFADACRGFDTEGSIYRTANGQCNNVGEPNWGAAETQFLRLIANAYDDETNIPRLRGAGGGPLPGVREVSARIHVTNPNLDVDRRWTQIFMQWGQFLDHDITATPLVDESEVCCTDAVKAGGQHPDVRSGGPCFPISIPENDAYFGEKGVTCMEFSRSLNISNGPREQENILTAFVDASQVYGSSVAEQLALRSGVNGQMLVANGEHLPEDPNGHCIKVEESDYCLLAGDGRVNVFPGLAALHTAFVRFHNQIASRIAETKDWTDEQIFQETRKIISAVMQHITYNEFLPEVIGVAGVEEHQLTEADTYTYDPTINPGIFNSFAAAALRFGHSTIVRNMNIGGNVIATEDLFLRPHYVLQQLRPLVETLIANPGAISDRYFVDAITNKLFITETGSFDLIALNLQRGRDHGLPSYNDFREQGCGLPRIRNFDDPVFRDFGNILSQVYASVDDIDLYTGGVAEANNNGGSVGPTFSCIIGKQFHNLKFGDSFWYETADSQRGFTPAQLGEIKKIFLSRVLCDTVAPFDRIQPFVMLPSRGPRGPRAGNEVTSCDQISNFDLDVLINNVEPASNQEAEVTQPQNAPQIDRQFQLNQGGNRPRNPNGP